MPGHSPLSTLPLSSLAAAAAAGDVALDPFIVALAQAIVALSAERALDPQANAVSTVAVGLSEEAALSPSAFATSVVLASLSKEAAMSPSVFAQSLADIVLNVDVPSADKFLDPAIFGKSVLDIAMTAEEGPRAGLITREQLEEERRRRHEEFLSYAREYARSMAGQVANTYTIPSELDDLILEFVSHMQPSMGPESVEGYTPNGARVL